jgi:hypothetical protein
MVGQNSKTYMVYVEHITSLPMQIQLKVVILVADLTAGSILIAKHPKTTVETCILSNR